MLYKQYQRSIFFLFCLISTISTLGNARNITSQNTLINSSITSAFIFGDSTVDPGNNDHIQTLFKGNFLPYGIDFPEQTPTGRFTNGRLPTDFIASYVGIKDYIPAYLDPNLNLKDLMTGVSFASAGTGYDPITAKRNKVIDLAMQLQYFDEYKNKLERMIGKKRVQNIIKNAVYVISCGTNDIIYTFGFVPDLTLITYTTISTYLHFMVKQNKWFLQALIDRGARRIGVVGLPPVGCLPIVVTLHSSLLQPRSCQESLSSIAREYNQMLQHQLITMQSLHPNTFIVYGDIYTPLLDQFTHPHKYGFEVADKGCCGIGLFEAGVACNSLTPICSDRSKYVFWDSIHPTEKSYYYLFQALRPAIDFVIKTSK